MNYTNAIAESRHMVWAGGLVLYGLSCSCSGNGDGDNDHVAVSSGAEPVTSSAVPSCPRPSISNIGSTKERGEEREYAFLNPSLYQADRHLTGQTLVPTECSRVRAEGSGPEIGTASVERRGRGGDTVHHPAGGSCFRLTGHADADPRSIMHIIIK